MDRRTLLKLMAATALAGCTHRPTKANHLRVVVAGAGIIGASIAYHLAKSGALVTVIDKQAPASHASRGTFAWINATWAKQPRHYHRFNQAGLAGWAELQRSLKLPVRWGGSLEWFDHPERHAQLGRQIAEQVAWGEPARMLSASAVRKLEPELRIESAATAAYSPNDGAVDPVLATQLLLKAAEQLGATIRYPCELTATTMSKGRLTAVATSKGVIKADRLVLATGAAPEPLQFAAGVDIPQRSTPGIIAITEPMPRLLNTIVVAPGSHMHQRNDGRIVLGEQGGAPNNAAHDQRLAQRPNDFPAAAIAKQHSARMLQVAAQFVPRMADAAIDAAYLGWRPLPVDGHPVIGLSPKSADVYIAIMHSGVSLAPIVGQLAAHELTERVVLDKLEQYRPTRSFETVRRY